MTLNPADYGQAPPADGWFPDPTSPGQERRWDGSAWTDEVRASPKAQLVDPGELATPDQLNAAILSAEAFTELVDLAPPNPPTGSISLLSVATAPKRSRGPRRLVGWLSLLLVFAGLAGVILAVYAYFGLFDLQPSATVGLGAAGGVLLLAGIVAGAIRTRR